LQALTSETIATCCCASPCTGTNWRQRLRLRTGRRLSRK
jgi:hypothetical protein